MSFRYNERGAACGARVNGFLSQVERPVPDKVLTL